MLSEINLYDKKGRLLLSKGHEISDNILQRLRCYYKLEENENIENKIDLQPVAAKLELDNNRVLDYPSDILNKILFESKTKPWWILINSFSNYDYWKYTHSVNVALMSLMVAIEIGYNIEKLWEIGLGALLHDIGKLLIPKSIIQKNSTLSEQEMEFVKQHCELGLSITQDYNLSKEVSDIIRSHHERNDGSGYPLGLKEGEIDQNVKIVIIADVIDAVSSYRPYRPAKKISEAIKMMKNEHEKFSIDLVMIMEQLINKTDIKK